MSELRDAARELGKDHASHPPGDADERRGALDDLLERAARQAVEAMEAETDPAAAPSIDMSQFKLSDDTPEIDDSRFREIALRARHY